MSEEFFEVTKEQIKSMGGGDGHWLNLAEGTSLIRIMPPWAAGETYVKEVKIHYGLADLVNYGLEVDQWFSEPCLADTGRCPICALSNKIKSVGTRTEDKDLLDLHKTIRAKNQYIVSAVNMEDVSEGVRLLRYGKQVNDAIRTLFQRKGNLTHPETGYNLLITKDPIPGQSWFKYSVSLDDKCSIMEHWASFKGQLNNLNEAIPINDYDAIQGKLDSVEVTPIAGVRAGESLPSALELPDPAPTDNEKLEELFS